MLRNFYPYAEDTETVLSRLSADKDTGLTTEDAKTRQDEYGLNELKQEKNFAVLKLVLRQFSNPLALLLLFAGITTIFLRENSNAVIIFAALFINAAIGFFQEKRMSDAFNKLRSGIKKFAVVLRNGRRQMIEFCFVVPGDILILKEGDMVAADARVIEEKGLSANESMFTGEWLPSKKSVEKVDLKSRVTEQTNMIFTGTLVVKGWAKAVVVSTGADTEFGRVAELVKIVSKKETLFQKNSRKISKFIGFAVVIAVLIIFFSGVSEGKEVSEMFLISVAVAVAAVPEGLPAAITVVLVLGMRNLFNRGGLPRNLAALETLGSADVILTDKTGTLTYARMRVSRIASPYEIIISFAKNNATSAAPLLKEEEKKETERIKILEKAQFTTEAFIENPEDELTEWVIRGNPMEQAILRAGKEAGINKEDLFTASPRLDFLPFESERKFFASLHKINSENFLFVSGAPETVLALCSFYLSEKGKLKRLTKQSKEKFLDYYASEASKGARMIALAEKKTEEKEILRDSFVKTFVFGAKNGSGQENKTDFFAKMSFLGLVGFHDPVREDAAEALAEARRAGIEIKIASGDNTNTTKAVAEKIGLISDAREQNSRRLTGDDLENLSKEDLKEIISDVDILSRVLPHQKMAIVEALQTKGNIVIMTGDGINDAPALNRADVGVALASGTDTAKEVSDIVLLNDSFKTIIEAVKQGRIIIDNIRKVITYLLSTGFTEVVLIGGAIIFGFPLPVLPAQILWANIVQEGFMNFAYAFEKEEDGVMSPESKQDKKRLFTREMKIMIFAIGILTDIILFALFFALIKIGYDLNKIRTMMFLGLTANAIFFAFSLKSFKKPLWKINILGNKYFLLAFALSVLTLAASFVLPPLSRLLSLSPITTREFLIMLCVGLFNLAAIETAKFLLNRRRAHGHPMSSRHRMSVQRKNEK